jgi:hypothetical protein
MPDLYINVKNLTGHRIIYKSYTEQSGTFDNPPHSLIPSSGVTNNLIQMGMSRSRTKEVFVGLALLIPAIFGVEHAAGVVVLIVETKSFSYTVSIGAKCPLYYGNRAGIEIRGGDLRAGRDKQTLHGVDCSGNFNVDDLCKSHVNSSGLKNGWHVFYEDTHSNDPKEGFTIQCRFDNSGSFNFSFFPLGENGEVYRG